MAQQLLSFGLAMGLASVAVAGPQYPPLTDQRFHYPDQIPYKIDTDQTGRGPQFGYNICNSTTEGQASNCQTAILNSIDDFCIWGPADPDSTIANEEAGAVSWCTKPGHGSRTIPAGTLSGVQVLNAPGYILFTGHLKQENINIQSSDLGGELDPHGEDQRGNPLGGIVYTNAFKSSGGNKDNYQQVIEWHNFLGSNMFCFKICDDSIPNTAGFCNNIFDRTGCQFVAPAAYKDNVFEVCDSENQDPVGIYTGADGAVSTYKQPPEGVEITSLPSVRTPSSSNCKTFTSADLYAAAASVLPTGSTTSASSSATGSSSGTGSSTGTGSVSGTTAKVSTSVTGTSSRASSTNSSPASTSNAAAARISTMGADAIGMGPVVAIAFSIFAGLGAVVAGL